LNALYPELLPIVEKALVFIQDTFAFNGEDDDVNAVLPDDIISLIERELKHVFGARFI
jgi:hypothetical protein